MKLLMVTQKIDKNDDILGIYHEWARAISKSFEKLSVICLYEGVNELPKEISVLSLGKEKSSLQFPINSQSIFKFQILKKIKYLWLFYKYIWRERKNYDAVFVHMNPIYVIIGWPIWKLLGKKIFLWYAHPAWHWKVKLGYLLSDKVITSVPEAFRVRNAKVIVVGQGIDVNVFLRNLDIERKKNLILSLGRLSPSKRIDLLIRAISIVGASRSDFALSIVGNPPPVHGAEEYANKLRNLVSETGLENRVQFHGAAPYNETVEWYNRGEIFINLSPTGHFDKTVLEAMATECVVLASNDAYKNVFPKDLHSLLIFRQDDAEDLALKLEKILDLPQDKRIEIGRKLREVILRYHSLDTLGERLRSAITSNA